MSDMAPFFSLFTVIPVILGTFFYYTHYRTYGDLDITTSSVAYNRTRYQQLLNWDKYALQVEGVPTQIHAGEFHYWRVPDQDRWHSILKQYRTSGFNTIRIYFHWGYHSPDEGIYLFDGNRDIEYLLTLCEEIGLFVLAAPGPYICAETQAGGYPSWLPAKRELRIRHNYMMLWRVYDDAFASYEIQWLQQILPIIAKHQITDNTETKKGCVLAVQIDNELFENMASLLPVGLHDQMRILAKAARDAGITVPLFSNDGFEEGSWVPHPESDQKKSSFWQKKKFGLDLYGFDKYVIFAPSSSPKSWLINSGVSVGSWKEWNPKNMENSMDKLEKKVRGFGGGARESPMFIPELQGGWFNHYKLQHTYDQIFDYFGEDYTKLLYETSLAQGVTMGSIYMIYGGTNWGTLGDPDVYTSYDYSACIREFGMLSSRGRSLRKSILLARSFDSYFTKTERVKIPNIKTSIPYTLNLQRESVQSDQAVTFNFFRNFDREKRNTFDVSVELKDKSTVTVGCHVPYKSSFIAIGNYVTQNGVHLILSTIPILARITSKKADDEVWVIEPNLVGSMIFENRQIKVTGNMQDNVLRSEGSAVVLSFEKNNGWTKIETGKGSLFIIGLDKYDSSTIYAEFDEPYWDNNDKNQTPFIAWGADEIYFNKKTQELEIKHRTNERSAHFVSFSPIGDKRITPAPALYDIPIVHSLIFDHHDSPSHVSIPFTNWESRSVDFSEMPWTSVKKQDGSIVFNSLDHHFTSGHILYRKLFKGKGKASLSLNARNRATVILNGKVIGGHTSYSRQLFSTGAKIGPDPWFLGTQSYDLTPHLSEEKENELVVVVESFGLSRQAFIMNDIRNPRGIIHVNLSGTEEEKEWEISGVDVRMLTNAYNTTGFPDEAYERGWKNLRNIEEDGHVYKVPILVTQGVQWIRFQFNHDLKKQALLKHVPLRIHLDGEWTAMIIVNDIFIARYYGNGDGPQHDFYLPEELLQAEDNSVKILAYTWEDTVGEIYIAGWPVLQDSGNLITHFEQNAKPQEYLVYKDRISM